MATDCERMEELLEAAKRRGASQAELFERQKRRLEVEVRDGEVEALETSRTGGLSLRLILDGRPGFAYSTVVAPQDGERCYGELLERAIESARWTSEDEHLGLPAPAAYVTPEVFDMEIEELGEEDALGRAIALEEATRGDRRIKRVRKASVTATSSETRIFNTEGIESAYRSTASTAQVMALAEEDGDSQTGWDYQGSRRLEDINVREVGATAAERAVRMLGARRAKACRSKIILESSVAVEFLGLFASLLSSEAVQKGKSLLAGKLGERVIADCLSIVDDGLLAWGLGSRPFDDEGVPSGSTSLIEGGVLGGYLYNTYTGRKDGRASTGNALRGSALTVPGVGPSNLVLASQVTEDNLFSAMGEGLYITEAMGIHMANPVSGEFSIGVSGIWVEDGELAYPIKEAVVSGNLLEFFRSVEATGKRTRFYGAMGSPDLLVGQVDLSG